MDKLTIFIAVTAAAAAVVLQMCILLALYLAVRKMQGVVAEARNQILPLAQQARELLTETAPKARQTGANLLATSVIVQARAEEISATVSALNARTWEHIERADGMIQHAVSKVERTGDAMERKMMVPVRTLQGVLAAVAAAVDSWRGGGRKSARA